MGTTQIDRENARTDRFASYSTPSAPAQRCKTVGHIHLADSGDGEACFTTGALHLALHDQGPKPLEDIGHRVDGGDRSQPPAELRASAFAMSGRPATDFQKAFFLGAEVLRREDLTRLGTVFNALPADKRELLILRFVAGLTAVEIASVIGKSHAATKKQLSRTLQALKEHYHDATP